MADQNRIELETRGSPLLEETVRSVQSAVSRARIAWITGLIVTFMFFASIYNGLFGFNKYQIQRRQLVYQIVDKDLIEIDSLQAVADSLSTDSQKVNPSAIKCFFAAKKKNFWEIAPLKEYYDAIKDTSVSDSIKESLKRVTLEKMQIEKQRLFDRQWSFDTIVIPGTTIAVTFSDIGVIGCIALLIVGFWLMANLLSEREALLRFLGANKDQKGIWKLDLTYAGFTSLQMRMAYAAISNTFVFSPSQKNRLLDWLNHASFIAPLLVGGLAVGKVWYDMLDKELWHWHWLRAVINAIVYLFVVIIWLKCLFASLTTTSALRKWKIEVVKEKETPVAHSAT